MLQVVWFKRDLRTADHAPLAAASAAGPVVCLYVIEPNYWRLADTSDRQWQFIRESLLDLDTQLTALGGQLTLYDGPASLALKAIHKAHGPFALHSHEETGNLWTYERDRAIARWCRQNRVEWQQYKQFGVQRGSQTQRGEWQQWRNQWLDEPRNVMAAPQFALCSIGTAAASAPGTIKQDTYHCPQRQRGGRREAKALLESFLNQRGERYRGSLSRTDRAAQFGSRLSAHLAYGTLSLRELIDALSDAQQSASGRWLQSLRSFESRLWWHCHFIQKLESQPNIERYPQIRPLAQLPVSDDQGWLLAWQSGATGWPMVDAAMRYLHHHGWVNFRMRAMLVSVGTHTLGLPWQKVAEWLAGQFVDYEPGIHYPQVQMQSGLSWNPVLRIYNPTTQARQFDPQGSFIRRWVPELRALPDQWLFEPWKLPTNLRNHYSLAWASYPAPPIDMVQANRQRKAAIVAIEQREGIERPNDRRERRYSSKQRLPKQIDHQQIELL